MKCKLHPRYKGVFPPTSKAAGCTCAAVYAEARRLRRLERAIVNTGNEPITLYPHGGFKDRITFNPGDY